MTNNAEVCQYLPLVKAIARKLYKKCGGALPSLCESDFESWGTIGLLHGLQDHDPEKTPDIKRYLGYRISWSIHEGIKAWGRSVTMLPQWTREEHDQVEIHFQDVYEGFEPGADPGQHDAYVRGVLLREVEKLPGRLRRVIFMRFYLGYQFNEISAVMGITKQRAEQLSKEAIVQLQVQQKELDFQRVARQVRNTNT